MMEEGSDHDTPAPGENEEEKLRGANGDSKKTRAPIEFAPKSDEGVQTLPSVSARGFQEHASSNISSLPEPLKDPLTGTLTDALTDQIASALKEACQKCPEIVKRESPLANFFAIEGQDKHCGAKRLALYWEARKTLFGPDRCFRRMTQTGDGAMAMTDIQVLLRTSFVTVLPADTEGRAVVCLHLTEEAPIILPQNEAVAMASTEVAEQISNTMQEGPESSTQRCIFYLLQACVNEATTQDIVILIVAPSVRIAAASKHKLSSFLSICSVMPLRIHSLRILVDEDEEVEIPNSGPDGSRRPCWGIEDLVNISLGNSIIRSFHTPSSCPQELAGFGLMPPGLPISAGGSWDRISEYQWHLRRVGSERIRIDKKPSDTGPPSAKNPIDQGISERKQGAKRASEKGIDTSRKKKRDGTRSRRAGGQGDSRTGTVVVFTADQNLSMSDDDGSSTDNEVVVGKREKKMMSEINTRAIEILGGETICKQETQSPVDDDEEAFDEEIQTLYNQSIYLSTEISRMRQENDELRRRLAEALALLGIIEEQH